MKPRFIAAEVKVQRQIDKEPLVLWFEGVKNRAVAMAKAQTEFGGKLKLTDFKSIRLVNRSMVAY